MREGIMGCRAILISLPFVFVSALDGLAQEGDATAGAAVFKKCAVCHAADTDQNKVGPSLNHVLGRKAGTHPDFKYSPAMLAAGEGGLVWDEATLRDYLHDPRKKVKGTKMAFPGLKDEADIANVVAYLKQFSK
jgi:cytochrome c